MLACHASQKEWLDESQGIDSYLTQMEEMTLAMGANRAALRPRKGGRATCI